jgi:hypothetical protein
MPIGAGAGGLLGKGRSERRWRIGRRGDTDGLEVHRRHDPFETERGRQEPPPRMGEPPVAPHRRFSFA